MRFFEEIAEREDRNLYEILLYPEGLFYKAYERSAFACVSRVSPFRPSKKRIKYCAREMVSVGFPMSVLSKYFPSAPRPLPDGRVVIALTDRIDPVACETWKVSLPLKERQPRGSAGRGIRLPAVPVSALEERPAPPRFVRPADLLPDAPAAASTATRPTAAADPKSERVMRMIRNFRLEAATPVECVLFVADLKKELDGYL